MGVYRVQSNGKAPSGLKAGDIVVTAGGTYKISGVNADGSYSSTLDNSSVTTNNYSGGYDKAASSVSASVSSASKINDVVAAAKNAVTSKVDNSDYVNTNDLAGSLNRLLGNTTNGSNSYTSSVPQAQTLSFEEALALAEQVLTPQYTAAYQQAAQKSAQNLDKAGLYNTLYGQALSAQAQQGVSRDLNSALGSLALKLTQDSEQNAYNLLKLAVDDQQFAAKLSSDQRQSVVNTLLKLLMEQMSA